MVRQCAANECHETDATMTTHRFPKDTGMATKWRDALNITSTAVPELQKGFVVCTKHFAPSSYRNEISNSLNTTAIPNREKNSDNERQFIKDKRKELSVPARCFKLPPTVNLQPEVQVFRCFKRTASNENQPVAKKQAIAVVRSRGETYEVVTDSSELSEVTAVEEKTEGEQRPLRQAACRQSLRRASTFVEASSVQKVPQAMKPVEKLTIPKMTKVCKTHKHSQTDEPPAQEPQQNENESKDDKIVALLYPEYRGINKVQLIEKVKEKDQRILALEEKVKKLEQAMRNLL